MSVVVTGGAGFVGTAVVDRLLAQGREVVVVDSLRADVHRDGGAAARARLCERGVDLEEIDVRDRVPLTDALRGAGAVVHLAAKVGLGVDLSDIDDYVSSNDLGTAVTLRAAADAGVPVVVQASSMVVYGEGRYTCPTHGVVPPGPRVVDDLEAGRFEPPCPRCGQALLPGLVDEDARLDPRNTYAATKVAQEHLAAVWARETGGRAVSLRLHNVYGPGMPRDTPYAGVAAIFLSALARGESPRVFEDGGQRRDFVHVGDVAAAFGTAVEAAQAASADADAGGGVDSPYRLGPHTALNVGSGVVSTVGDMSRALARAAGGQDPVVTGGYRLGDVRHITASSERAARVLGWRAAIALQDGVVDLVREAGLL
ncbi:MAG: NAD-dependent epimerase/dehydratase family protein [Actinomycetota bacterium]|nr:NAD-dependent epimerase/dehydratase family protein [Actinomycetota bacterium]